MKTIKIHLLTASEPIIILDAINAYTKDLLYCVELKDRFVKYPLTNIFRIEEIK